MPKPRIKETIQCAYFRWNIGPRDGIYYADGRSNPIKLGRHSLDSKLRESALENLQRLDLIMAVEHGIADRSMLDDNNADGLTLQDGWDLYFASIEARRATEGLSAKTPKRYRAVRDKFLVFSHNLGVRNCQQIAKSLLMAYAAWLNDDGYEYSTRYLEITTLKQWMKFLISEQHLPATAAFKLPMRKPEESDTYCYTLAEVDAMLLRCRTMADLNWLHPVIMTLAYTGMRISELASLRWTDIDYDHNLILLSDERHSAARRRQGTARELKGKRSRSFPIHPELRPILEGISKSNDGFVFHGAKGGRIKPDRVRRCLIRDLITPLKEQFPAQAGAATSFVDGRVHSFRHFFCSVCANSRIAEQTLMMWLGHRSSKMIKRYYHLHDDASQRAMQSVNFSADASKT